MSSFSFKLSLKPWVFLYYPSCSKKITSVSQLTLLWFLFFLFLPQQDIACLVSRCWPHPSLQMYFTCRNLRSDKTMLGCWSWQYKSSVGAEQQQKGQSRGREYKSHSLDRPQVGGVICQFITKAHTINKRQFDHYSLIMLELWFWIWHLTSCRNWFRKVFGSSLLLNRRIEREMRKKGMQGVRMKRGRAECVGYTHLKKSQIFFTNAKQ